MAERVRERLSHVLWIGGGTDAGKTSVARLLSETHRLPVYHYDQADLRHHVRLAQTSPRYAAFLDASMEERWVRPEQEALAERAWQAFRDRFALVMEDLTALSFPEGMRVLVEGFGLTPELLEPVLAWRRQAIWLVPTETFKLSAMERRGKGRFGGEVSDAHRASRNLLELGARDDGEQAVQRRRAAT
jgi:2-phosphoglycerate kinase